MALGSGPFGAPPFGGSADTAGSDTLAELSSSRKIDARGRYVLDADGGFESMDDVAQRVLLAVCFAARDLPKIVSPQAFALGEARIKNALKPLTGGEDPAVKLERVAFTNPTPGVVKVAVGYKNLLTGTSSTVEKRL
jgi:hypothetical protein